MGSFRKNSAFIRNNFCLLNSELNCFKSPAMLQFFLFEYRPFSIFSTSYVCSVNLWSVSCIQQTVYLCILCSWQWSKCVTALWKLYEWWMWALISAGWYPRLRLSAWIMTGSKIRANKHTLYRHTHILKRSQLQRPALIQIFVFLWTSLNLMRKMMQNLLLQSSVYLSIHWCWLLHTELHTWKYILSCVRPLLIHAELTFSTPDKRRFWKALSTV